MIKNRASSPCPSARESIWGACYLLFQMLVLPSFLYWANGQVDTPLSDPELNFLFYIVNFVAVLLIFHDFLARSLSQLLHHPIDALQAAILGFVAYYVCFYAIDWVVSLLLPGYTNYNDESIAALSRGNYFLMFIGTVILVPPAEECLYRGLIFRNLYKKSHWAAYVISIAAFSCLHILGYIGVYSARDLIIAFIQYIPAGLWLAWSYIKGESIFVPILIHAAVNFITIRGIL
jgi:membrane protease YdiL (CAAX protease family)